MNRARFVSRCPECAERIEEGDCIVMTDHGAIRADCAEDTYRYNADRYVTVCDRCNLTKPCECEDD